MINGRRVRGGHNTDLGVAESGVTTHNFPAATSSGDAGADATTDLFNSTQLIPTIDLMSKIRTKGVVQFVVLELDQT